MRHAYLDSEASPLRQLYLNYLQSAFVGGQPAKGREALEVFANRVAAGWRPAGHESRGKSQAKLLEDFSRELSSARFLALADVYTDGVPDAEASLELRRAAFEMRKLDRMVGLSGQMRQAIGGLDFDGATTTAEHATKTWDAASKALVVSLLLVLKCRLTAGAAGRGEAGSQGDARDDRRQAHQRSRTGE